MENSNASSDKTMKVFIPFLKATAQVLEEITQEVFTKKNIYSFQGNLTLGQIKVEIGIVGDIKTRVIFDFPMQFAKDLTAIMMGIADPAEITNDIVIEACQEIGNMISGNAMGFLEENNIYCDITPPSVFLVRDKDVEISDRTSIGVIELTSNIGDFNICVVINENDSLQNNINLLTVNFDHEKGLLLSRFFFPKGIGIINTTHHHVSKFITHYKPEVVFINSNEKHYKEVVAEIKSLEGIEKTHIVSFGDERIEELNSFSDYKHYQEIEDPYNFVENVKSLMGDFKIKVFTHRKEYIVNIPASESTCLFAVTTKNGDYEEIPVIRLGLESIILDITKHMDINFPEEKSLTKNIAFRFQGGVTAPISKVKIGKTLANGRNVQIFLDHIFETEIYKITEFMYKALSHYHG